MTLTCRSSGVDARPGETDDGFDGRCRSKASRPSISSRHAARFSASSAEASVCKARTTMSKMHRASCGQPLSLSSSEPSGQTTDDFSHFATLSHQYLQPYKLDSLTPIITEDVKKLSNTITGTSYV